MPLKGCFPTEILLNLLFPSRCRLCDQPLRLPRERVACRNCLEAVVPAGPASCPICGLLPGSPEREVCGLCRLDPPEFVMHRSFALYEGPLRELIQLYKFHELESLAGILAGYGLQELSNGFPAGLELLLPVPADRSRRRGFAPLTTLARSLARRSGLQLQVGNLVKTRSTRPQVGLDSRERRRNLAGAFSLRRPQLLADRKVLLLDDVWTTGSTMRECARVLHAAGALVYSLTIARTPL